MEEAGGKKVANYRFFNMNSHLGARSRARADTLPRMPTEGLGGTAPQTGGVSSGGMGSFDRDRAASVSSPPVLVDNLPEAAVSLASSSVSRATSTLLFLNLPPDPLLTNAGNFSRMLAPFGPLVSVKTVVCLNNVDRVVLAHFGNVSQAVLCMGRLNGRELAPGYACVVSYVEVAYSEAQPVAQSAQQFQHLQQFQSLQNTQNVQHLQHAAPPGSGPLYPQDYFETSLHSRSFLSQSQPMSAIPVLSVFDTSPAPSTPHLSSKSNSSSTSNSTSNSTSGPKPITVADIASHLDTPLPPHTASILARCASHVASPIRSSSHSLRTFDTPTLRDTRKALDAKSLSPLRIDELTLAMGHDIPLVASDYLGNTIVQRLITDTSPEVQLFLVSQLASHLPSLAIHKNGTWVAQKVVNNIPPLYAALAMTKLAHALTPYVRDLICDTYGNYLVQAILQWEDPYGAFVWVGILHGFQQVATNRYGARALRTCLETLEKGTGHAREIVKLVSAAILAHASDIAFDPNGSLLVTWFLDSCKEWKPAERARMVANALAKDHDKLIKVCGSKLGGMVVMRLLREDLDEQNEQGALPSGTHAGLTPASILLPLIFNNHTLTSLLSPSSPFGPTVVGKLLSLSALDPLARNTYMKETQNALNEVIAQNQGQLNHQMKRLAEDCGLRLNVRSGSMSNVWGPNNASANTNNGPGGPVSTTGPAGPAGPVLSVTPPSLNPIVPSSWQRSMSNLSTHSIRSRSNSSPYLHHTPPPYDPFMEDALLRQQLEGLMINTNANGANGGGANGFSHLGMQGTQGTSGTPGGFPF